MRTVMCDCCGVEMQIEKDDLHMLHFCDACLDVRHEQCETVRSNHGI